MQCFFSLYTNLCNLCWFSQWYAATSTNILLKKKQMLGRLTGRTFTQASHTNCEECQNEQQVSSYFSMGCLNSGTTSVREAWGGWGGLGSSVDEARGCNRLGALHIAQFTLQFTYTQPIRYKTSPGPLPSCVNRPKSCRHVDLFTGRRCPAEEQDGWREKVIRADMWRWTPEGCWTAATELRCQRGNCPCLNALLHVSILCGKESLRNHSEISVHKFSAH